MELTRDIVLFLAASLGVVVVTAFLAHADDRPAWHSVPRRAFVFVGSCAVLAVLLTVFGAWFAALDR